MTVIRSIQDTLRGIACFACVVTLATTMSHSSIAYADELNASHVPADAKWLIHVDQQKLSNLELVESLRAKYPQITGVLREWLRSGYGIDPRKDLRSVTMFSRDYRPHTGTVLLQTQYDEKKIKADIYKNKSLKKTEWKGRVLYTVTLAKHKRGDHSDDRKQTRGATGDPQPHNQDTAGNADMEHDLSGGKQMTVYLGDELIVLASSVPNAKSVLRLLAGDAPSLQGMDSPLTARVPAGAMIYGAAIELGRLDRYQMLMPLLQQQEQCVYAFSQRDGTLVETLTLTAQSDEVARKTTEVLEGIIAYEKLWASGSESLTELMNDVQLSCDGTKSMVSWEGEPELVVEAFGDLSERLDQWTKLFSN